MQSVSRYHQQVIHEPRKMNSLHCSLTCHNENVLANRSKKEKNAVLPSFNFWTSSAENFPPKCNHISRCGRSSSPSSRLPQPCANSNIANKRFSDLASDVRKQEKQRHHGEFIMRTDNVDKYGGRSTPSSSISESNSSQTFLLTKQRVLSTDETKANQNQIRKNGMKNFLTNSEETRVVREGKSRKTASESILSEKLQSKMCREDGTLSIHNDKSCHSSIFSKKIAYPNIALLRRITNPRNKAENVFTVLKIVSCLHLTLGLVMLSLDWAQTILLWQDSHLNVQQKVAVLLRCMYPVYVLLIGTVTALVAMRKKSFQKTLKLMCIVFLAIICLVPSDLVLFKGMSEAMQFSMSRNQISSQRLEESGSTVDMVKPIRSTSTTKPHFIFPTSRLPLQKSPLIFYSKTAITASHAQRDIADAAKELTENPALYKSIIENYISSFIKEEETVTTVHNLQVAYCFLGAVHIALTIFTLFAIIKLDRAQ